MYSPIHFCGSLPGCQDLLAAWMTAIVYIWYIHIKLNWLNISHSVIYLANLTSFSLHLMFVERLSFLRLCFTQMIMFTFCMQLSRCDWNCADQLRTTRWEITTIELLLLEACIKIPAVLLLVYWTIFKTKGDTNLAVNTHGKKNFDFVFKVWMATNLLE